MSENRQPMACTLQNRGMLSPDDLGHWRVWRVGQGRCWTRVLVVLAASTPTPALNCELGAGRSRVSSPVSGTSLMNGCQPSFPVLPGAGL